MKKTYYVKASNMSEPRKIYKSSRSKEKYPSYGNGTFDVDDVEELQDITDNYNIEYRVDGLLDIGDDKRVDLITTDITDTLEKDFDREAF